MKSDRERPFAFEELPIKDGKRVEPETWGPRYSKPAKAKRINDETNIPTNCASGQKGDFSAAKHRAKLKAEFAALANADKRDWAGGKPVMGAYGKTITIADAYEEAMRLTNIHRAGLAAVEAGLATLAIAAE